MKKDDRNKYILLSTVILALVIIIILLVLKNLGVFNEETITEDISINDLYIDNYSVGVKPYSDSNYYMGLVNIYADKNHTTEADITIHYICDYRIMINNEGKISYTDIKIDRTFFHRMNKESKTTASIPILDTAENDVSSLSCTFTIQEVVGVRYISSKTY